MKLFLITLANIVLSTAFWSFVFYVTARDFAVGHPVYGCFGIASLAFSTGLVYLSVHGFIEVIRLSSERKETNVHSRED